MNYILRTCNADMTSRNGFKWPKRGWATAPDWLPTNECGNGLHGFLNGEGDGSLACWDADAMWLVASVNDYIDLGDKVKFPKAYVLHAGTRQSATAFLADKVGNRAIIGRHFASDAQADVFGGDLSTLSAGPYSNLVAGSDSALIAGDYSTLTAGGFSALKAGKYSILTAGNGSTLTSGERSILTWKIFDGKDYRLHTFYVGETYDGVLCEPNTTYVFENGKLKKRA